MKHFIFKLAFSSSADFMVAYNTSNFKKATSFGVAAIKPKDFLRKIGEIS
jgi:hypothetical protein